MVTMKLTIHLQFQYELHILKYISIHVRSTLHRISSYACLSQISSRQIASKSKRLSEAEGATERETVNYYLNRTEVNTKQQHTMNRTEHTVIRDSVWKACVHFCRFIYIRFDHCECIVYYCSWSYAFFPQKKNTELVRNKQTKRTNENMKTF